MWHDWWMAHRAEIIVEAVFAAVLLGGILVIALVLAWKNRGKR